MIQRQICVPLFLLITLLLCVSVYSQSPDDEIITKKRVLFVSISFHGHIGPTSLLAYELSKDAAYSVVLASHEDARSHVSLYSKYGLSFVSLGKLSIAKELEEAQAQQLPMLKYLSAVWVKLFPIMTRELYVQLSAYLQSEIDAGRKPDLMVVDTLTHAGTMAAVDFNIPYVSLQSSILVEPFVNLHYPMFGTGLRFPMSFLDKLYNVVWPIMTAASGIGPYSGELQKMRAEMGLPPLDIGRLFAGNATIIAMGFGFEYSRRLPPNVFLVGPLLPLDAADESIPPLAKYIREFINSAGDAGVVYVSFGTAVQLNKQQAAAIIAALSNQPFKVIWSLRESQRHILPPDSEIPKDQFLIVPWLSQKRLLSHRMLKLFVTHCGANSIAESIINGKPLVGIPVFADQFDNAARLIDSGVGTALHSVREMTEDKLRESVRHVYDNVGQYTMTATRLSRVLRSAGGLRKAVQVIDLVATVGTQHLVPVENQLPFWDRNNLDLAAFALVVLYVLYRIIKAVLCALFSFFCCSLCRKKPLSDRNRSAGAEPPKAKTE